MTVKTKKPILMRCLTPKCPRTLRINRDDFMPNGTVEVRQPCPWHTKEGDKEYPVEFYDKDGKEIEGDFFREVHES